MQTEIRSEVKEILGCFSENKPDAGTIDMEYRKYTERFLLSPDDAKRALVRKYEGDSRLLKVEPVMISEVTGEKFGIELTVKVLSLNNREILDSDGKPRIIYFGILGDSSGVISFTSWADFPFKKGDGVRIRNAYSRVWNGRVQLYINGNSSMEPVTIEDEVYNPLKQYPVNDLTSRMYNCIVEGEILEYKKRTIFSNGDSITLRTGVIGDNTGIIPFTCWEEFPFRVGDTIIISECYTSGFSGYPQLVIGRKSEVSRSQSRFNDIPEYNTVGLETVQGQGKYKTRVPVVLSDVKGGVINRCPECNRKIEGDSCPIHGKAEETVLSFSVVARVKKYKDRNDRSHIVKAHFNDISFLETITGGTYKDLETDRERINKAVSGLDGVSFEVIGDIQTNEYGENIRVVEVLD